MLYRALLLQEMEFFERSEVFLTLTLTLTSIPGSDTFKLLSYS